MNSIIFQKFTQAIKSLNKNKIKYVKFNNKNIPNVEDI